MREELLALLRMAGNKMLASISWQTVLMAVLFMILLIVLFWVCFQVFAKKRKGLIDDCPHCGAPAGFRTFQNYDGNISCETGAVVCTQCGAQTKEEIISGYYGISVTPEAIIQKWNRRCWR